MQVRSFLEKNRYPIVLLLVSLCMYGYLSLHNGISFSSYYTGDEPHYVVIIKSLARGHLYVEVYSDPRPEWTTWPYSWHAVKGPDGHFYSTHGIGFPILAASFYIIGGSLGVILFIPLVTSLVNLFQYFACRRITGDDYVSFITALVMGFATLVCAYSNQFYPELLMALLLLISLNLVLKYGLTNSVQVAIGLLIGYGFLLKAAFAAIVAGYGLALFIICIRKRRLNFVLFVAPVAVWFAAFCFYNTTAFGNPFAVPLASGESGYNQIIATNAIFATTGLIFDRYRGLLPYSPILLLSILGLKPLIKERSDVFALATAAVLAEYLVSSLFTHWWAGWSLPARYLISVLPLFSLPLSLALKNNLHKPWFKIGTYCTIYLGLYLNLTMSWPRAIGLNVNSGKSDMLSRAYLGFDNIFPVILNSQDLLNISLTQLLLWLSGLTTIILLALLLTKFKTLRIRPSSSAN
ncbi:MAG: hypothetical protein ACLPY5_03110 [Candidatus Bathyarchaeia archaeon]